MKLQIFAVILFVFSSINSNLYAQWESLGDDIIPENHRVWSIKVAQDLSIWAISTYDKFPPINYIPKVHRSADGGMNWTGSEITAAISTYGWDISPVDSMTAFIALDTAGLFKTLDGGQSWNKVENYLFRPYCVHFFNENEGWIRGDDSTGSLVMSITEDGGNNWLDISYSNGQPTGTSLPPIDSAELVLTVTFSVNSAYDYTEESIIVGTNKGTYWKSSDKGRNWTRHNSPLEGLDLMSSNIAMKDENTFMIAGDLSASSIDEATAVNFTTTDGGKTWIEGRSGMTAAATHYIPNSDSIFIMVGHGDFGWGSQGTAISYDYGETWELIDSTSLISIDFIDENNGVGTCCNYDSWTTANGQIHKWNFDLPTSTFDLIDSDLIKIMPNPVSSNLTIETNMEFTSNSLIVEVISVTGQVLISEKHQNRGILNISTNNLLSGFYSLRIKGDQKIVVKKFIKA
jgi:photosystem II stability/assembly factor-like uncharacterized protein